MFKQAVSPLPEELAKLAEVSFEWRENTFQEFIDIYSSSQSESERYPFYFISVLHRCRRVTFNLLQEACLVTGTQDSWLKISQKFRGKINFGNICYTAQDVIAIAQRNGWKYEELPKLHFQLDVTGCFDKSSQTGRLILDFITHQINFRVTADPSLHKEFMDFLSEISTSDNSGNKLILEEIETVAVYK